MAENNNGKCPCCGRNCDLSEPHCGRGEEYARTGVIPQRDPEHEHSHEHEHEHEHKHGCGKHRNPRHSESYAAMDADNKLIVNLRDIGHTMRCLFEGKGSQKRILIILSESESITQRELTERLGIQPGSASEVIGKLENAGLIVRDSSTTDRRTVDIRLTDEGRAQAEEAVNQRKARHREMFSCLSEEEKSELLSLAEKLNSDWDSRYRGNFKGHGHHGGCHRQ
ncbi:MAG: MarR family winged helix-turn-helix transcriptional regulator [Clostridia bacterium]